MGLEYWFTASCTAIFGAVIGSFLSVCIYRIPLGRPTSIEEWETEESDEDEGDAPEPEIEDRNSEHFDKKVTVACPPRSFCPHCGEQLAWYHNIPILSWVFLRGKCSFCKDKISGRYPLVELLSTSFALLCLGAFGLNVTSIIIYFFCCALLVISFIDFDYYIIPNVISYPATLIGFILAAINQFSGVLALPIVPGIKEAIYGILAGAGVLFVISEGYFRIRGREGLGMGDVKLLAMTGVLFGPSAALYTIFVGSVLGSVVGIALIIIGGRKMSQYLPFGPYLALATLLFLFVGVEGTIEFLGLNPRIGLRF